MRHERAKAIIDKFAEKGVRKLELVFYSGYRRIAWHPAVIEDAVLFLTEDHRRSVILLTVISDIKESK